MLSLFNQFISLFKNKVETRHFISDEDKNKQRCLDILNYWLTIELFELPECPLENRDKTLSIDATEFESEIDILAAKIIENPNLINEESRLTIMFQCHRAGYVLIGKEDKTNSKIPLTFLVSHNFVPKFEQDSKEFSWQLSEDNADTAINFATLYTLFEHCPSSTATNQSLSQWLQTRKQVIDAAFTHHFAFEMDTATFKQKIIDFNRNIAKEFWAYSEAREFMHKYCSALELEFDREISEKDQPKTLSDQLLTFKWRFCFYSKKPELQQIGPFFVKDLNDCLIAAEKNNLSAPLETYLLGQENQKLLPEATDNGEIYLPLTDTIPQGRWAGNPKYGLSLMQTVAVNAALSTDPVTAVNGPPGTGKTTLLKDVIATQFVERTLNLQKIADKSDWFNDPKIHELIMRYSMIVASSNNKAVENISKELPEKNGIDTKFENQLRHFSSIAEDNDWGLFCAVLGNSKNRKIFKKKLKDLQGLIKNYKDIFGQNVLKFTDDNTKNLEIILKFVRNLRQNGFISKLLCDWKTCSHFNNNRNFTEPFASALTAIDKGELSETEFAKNLEKMNEHQWQEATETLEKLKRQWFAKGCYQQYIEQSFKQADERLNHCKQKYQQLLNQNDLDEKTHLLSTSSYESSTEEEKEMTEKRLQQSSPFSSETINRARSELFCASILWNEAFLKRSSEQFDTQLWDDLQSLIDGNLQGVEKTPYYAKLWSLLFLFFPVVSSSLSSVENQFRLMKKTAGFGTAFIDEAGQAINYHVVGLLQRCRKAVFVGDPIQLEPVVTLSPQDDRSIAEKYLQLSNCYSKNKLSNADLWAENYIVSTSSAQSIADLACKYYSNIGQRKVGIPLFVHRRCEEPMFSISNKIAYDNKMVYATNADIAEYAVIPSCWINVSEIKSREKNYRNRQEAETAISLIEHLIKYYPKMVEGGVFIITPFTQMKDCLTEVWKQRATEDFRSAFGKMSRNKTLDEFASDNIGTVHTFQGKEAAVVILCLAASVARDKTSGITWVNSKPNLLNVAVTRAKKHLFVIGNINDWQSGQFSSEMQNEIMVLYDSFEDFKLQKAKEKMIFNFGA